jgi:hypothetical protein
MWRPHERDELATPHELPSMPKITLAHRRISIVHHSTSRLLMSAWGQSRSSGDVRVTSAYPPKAAQWQTFWHFVFVPLPDQVHRNKNSSDFFVLARAISPSLLAKDSMAGYGINLTAKPLGCIINTNIRECRLEQRSTKALSSWCGDRWSASFAPLKF